MRPVVDSRAACGLRSPRDVSKDVHPEHGGLAVHWGGERLRLGNHEQCRATWRQWQALHMDPPRDWVDIAYNWGACDHGHLLTGRGWGVRSAANGTNDANERFLAVCWLGGPGESPSALALGAIEYLVQYVRGRGAGREVRPHSHFYPTACPGPVLTAHTQTWARLGGPSVVKP